MPIHDVGEYCAECQLIKHINADNIGVACEARGDNVGAPSCRLHGSNKQLPTIMLISASDHVYKKVTRLQSFYT